jgi:ABC-type spermidine/putrescine transport system permease subunit I
MKTIHSLDVAGTAQPFAAGSPMPFAMTITRMRKRKRESVLLSEVIPLWFAISSPLIGLVLGFLGAWFVTWLTS